MGNHQELDNKFLRQYFNYKLAKNFDFRLFIQFLGVYMVSYIPIYFAPQPLKILIHGTIALIILYYANSEAYPLLFIMTIGSFGVNQLLDIYIYQETGIYFSVLAFGILSIIVYLKNLISWRHFLSLSSEFILGESDLNGKFIVTKGIISGSNKKFCSMIKKDGYCFVENKPTLQSLLEDDEFNRINGLMEEKKPFSCSIRLINDFDNPLEFLIRVIVNTKGTKPIYLFSVSEPLKRISDNLRYIQNNYSIVSNFSGISIIERDVSKLQQAMRVIKEKGIKNKDDFKKYCYKNPEIIYELSSMTAITNLNDECVKLFEGESKQDVIDYIQGEPEMHVEDFVNSLSFIFEETGYQERETFLITMKNNRKDVLMKSKYPSKEGFNFVTVIIDITDTKLAKENLIESEEKYEALFQSGPLGAILHEDGIIIDVNSEALKIYNINTSEEIIGTNLLELIPENTRADMQKMGKMRLEGTAPSSYRSEGIKRDGTIFPVTVYPTLIKLRGKLLTLTFIEDITELVNSETESVRIQNQLMKSHKLESLGILAGGIAHDFNNLLMIIKGGLELLTLSDNFNADQMDLTQELLDASNNATNLTNQLLLYTGRSKIETESNKLIDLFEELKGLIKLSTRSHITLNYHFDIDEKVYVQLTNSQFSQLILNLVINSSRACLDTDAEICISSQVVSKDEINLNAPNTLFEGEVKNCDFVNIQIKDNGIGMDEVMITRIFDPFFTNTKGGRGLGLSVVQGIVFQNRGVIQVNSSLGNGTSINIYLPLTKSTIAKKDMKGQKNDIILMSKTILLCEDDPAVRRIITTMLKRLEHVVIEAEDGVIGIQKFEANMKEIDLVILDLTMPNMSGKETYNLLIQLKNDIPILISSGYSEESISEFTDYQFVDFLQKPYKLADLNSKIKDILML